MQTGSRSGPELAASAKQPPLLAEIAKRLVSVEAKIDTLRQRFDGRLKSHFTSDEFAELVGRSSYTVRRWVSDGRITATRVQGTGPRGRLLIPRSELERVVADGRGAAVPDAMVE
jgi:excisionase family DNA binding protein